jgi:hypothetical protein
LERFMPIQRIDFSFLSDERIRRVLENYYSQAVKAYEVGSYLATLVACGSVLEGLLTFALLQRKDAAQNSSKACKDKKGIILPLEKWNLTNLVDVADDLNLIGKTAKQASWAVKEFRNFIHPYNMVTQSARPDQALAMSALAAVEEITRSLSGRI